MAKRLLAMIMCIPLIFCLFSCQKKQEGTGTGSAAPALPTAFATKAWVKTGQIELTCTLERRLLGVYTAAVISPQEIEGLTFSLEGEVLKISFEGKEYEIPPSELPETSFFSMLVSALDASMRVESLTAQKQEGGFLIKGSCSKGEFQMAQKGNALESLKIGDALQATFSDFQAAEIKK